MRRIWIAAAAIITLAGCVPDGADWAGRPDPYYRGDRYDREQRREAERREERREEHRREERREAQREEKREERRDQRRGDQRAEHHNKDREIAAAQTRRVNLPGGGHLDMPVKD